MSFKLENFKLRNFNVHAFERLNERKIDFNTLKSLTWFFVSPQYSQVTGQYTKYTCTDQLERYVLVVDFIEPDVIDIITVFFNKE